MTTCLQSAARGAAPLAPALQLIATTAASWNLIAPVRTRRRVRRIALRGLARPGLTRPGLTRPGLTRPGLARPGCGTAGAA